MPRFYVQRPDGLWNIFSTVLDEYISEGLTLDGIKKFRADDFNKNNEREVNSLLTERPELNIMSFDEAEERISCIEKEETEE